MLITMNALVVFIIACVAVNVNGLPKPLISGGEDVPIVLYPYQASLRYDGNHCCNGAIISERYILTVAQCVYNNEEPFLYSVGVGSDVFTTSTAEYDVERIIVHRDYNKQRHTNDIALIRVAQNIKYNVTIQPIALPTAERDYDDYPLIVTGWTKNSNGNYSYSLLEILVRGYPQKLCNSEYGFIEESHICTKCQEAGEELCAGDSGDPVVINGVLIGLVSHVRCNYNYPDISTRVFYHKSWINRMIENNQ